MNILNNLPLEERLIDSLIERERERERECVCVCVCKASNDIEFARVVVGTRACDGRSSPGGKSAYHASSLNI